MLFYCPDCRKEYDVEPSNTVTTQNKRVAYKANCPVCGQDMAEFVPEAEKQTQAAASPSPSQSPTSVTKEPTTS